jgi:probable UDP-sugar transporter A4
VLICSVSGFIYTINNNLAFIVLDGMIDPASYQLLSNMKILTTALLFYVIMKKPLSVRQWVALALLAAGCSLAALNIDERVDDAEAHTNDAVHEGKHMRITPTGFLVMVVYCTLSGLAGVYSEKMLKDTSRIFHVSNTLLYAWGIVFNAFAFVRESGGSDNAAAVGGFSTLFTGYNGWAVAMMLNQAFTGLILSLVMRFLDNIVKLFTIACSLLLTTLWAASVLSFNIHSTFYFACVCIIAAIFLYNLPPHVSVTDNVRESLCASSADSSARDGASKSPVSRRVILALVVVVFVYQLVSRGEGSGGRMRIVQSKRGIMHA